MKKRLEEAKAHAWRRWKREYIHSLMEGHRLNKKEGATLVVGEVVLVDGDEKNRGEWKKGKVTRLIQVPVSNIVTSSNQTVSLSDELTLSCSADGRPKPTITWTRLSDNTVVNMTLNISSKQYGGCYRCTADNGVGKALTKDVCINVLFPPIVTLKSNFFVGREQPASLKCEVEGNPTPSVHWNPCDLPHIGCNKEYLDISKVQTPRANYTCTGSNYLGNDSETTLLVIGGKNIFISLSTSEECDEKESVWETLQHEAN
ncbi:limbic system-associated membrane protein-like [Montipora capricornis]|uniref:limbic system-associated membrane protein-like n=1 Tax=Montipora capricornis TaxID=246305 RepID=UPI0035F1FC35